MDPANFFWVKVIWEDFTTASLSILKSKNKPLETPSASLTRSVDPRQKKKNKADCFYLFIFTRISIPPTKRSDKFNQKKSTSTKNWEPTSPKPAGIL